MMTATLAFLLVAQPVLAARKPIIRPVPPPAPAAASPALNEADVLKKAHLDATGPALLDFFRNRVNRDVAAEHLAQLTKQLGDKDQAARNKAMAELVGLGPTALPALRRVVNNADSEETLTLARSCLESIEGAGGSAVVQSAVRMLASSRPEGAAEALVNYLPFADDETVVQEIETALVAVGVRDGKPESALMRALTDATPIRRNLAARVLCQVGGTVGRDAVRPLLKDAKPSVRMQAALSLTESHDAEAVPVLIDLVADLPPDGRKRVEEYLSELAGEWAVQTPQGSDAVSKRLRRELWSSWWRTLDGKQLLEEFQNRTLTDDERTHALEAIAKLNDASADVRAKASEELIDLGPRVASLLRQTLEQGNAKLAGPVRQCLAALDQDASKPLPDAAPRLLALRRPKGTVEALLGYVPFAESDTVGRQLGDLLASVGCPDGKADPALVRALEDKVPVRRAAAAAALCKGKAENELPAVRKLLRDADATVRLRTAVALAQSGDKTGIPVLIALLADLPLERVWEAEDVLTALAGENGPTERVSTDKDSRTASVTAWKAWWQKEEKTVDLARLADSERSLGTLLVVDMQQGGILEINRNGKVRWKLQGPQWPWDAVVCRNGNVFVAQHNNNQVALWSRQGKELWSRPCNLPFACQQLRNGNLFVVCRNHVAEYDLNGKEISTQMHNVGWIVGGCKYPNGHVGLFTQQGQYIRLDAAGKQVKNFNVAFPGGVAMYAEVLPNDHVIASLNTGRVGEYDPKGKAVWEANIINPVFPSRLPNGHTLVSQNGTNHFYDLDRNGKVASEKKDLEYHPWRIKRR